METVFGVILLKCWCSSSLPPPSVLSAISKAGTRGSTESSHLQVLLLPGEGVGETLHRLRLVFCHFGLDGLRYLLNYRIDLLQKPVGLVDLIHLNRQREKQGSLNAFG